MESEPWWIGALISFSATFAGVAASFGVERWRSTKHEKDDFGKVLQSLLAESANNHAHLTSIESCNVGAIPGFSLNKEVLGLALGNPLFLRWAKHSLVLAASIVASHIELVNNMISMFRVSTGQLNPRNIEELKIRAKQTQSLIVVMQELIDAEMPTFGGHPRADVKTKEIHEKLKNLLQRKD